MSLNIDAGRAKAITMVAEANRKQGFSLTETMAKLQLLVKPVTLDDIYELDHLVQEAYNVTVILDDAADVTKVYVEDGTVIVSIQDSQLLNADTDVTKDTAYGVYTVDQVTALVEALQDARRQARRNVLDR